MEFRVKLPTPLPDVGYIDELVRGVDPAAIVDVDPTDRSLRVTAWLAQEELVRLLVRAGYPIGANEVQALPSVCCGGCGG